MSFSPAPPRLRGHRRRGGRKITEIFNDQNFKCFIDNFATNNIVEIYCQKLLFIKHHSVLPPPCPIALIVSRSEFDKSYIFTNFIGGVILFCMCDRVSWMAWSSLCWNALCWQNWLWPHRSNCFCFPSARFKGRYYHAWPYGHNFHLCIYLITYLEVLIIHCWLDSS